MIGKRRFILVMGLVFLGACQTANISTGGPETGPTPTPLNSPVPPTPRPDITGSPPTAVPTKEPTTGSTEALPLVPKTLVRFPEAGSIDFTVDNKGHIYLVYGQANNVYLTQSDDGGQTFNDPVTANSEENVFVYPLERPAIAVGPDERIHIAWPEDNYPGRIWYAVSEDKGKTFSPAVPLSEAGPETVLVRLLLEPDGTPLAVWLQNSELHLNRTIGTDESSQGDQLIDDQTCDCCHPQPLWLNDQLHIAYRNLVIDDDHRHIRDIYMVTSAAGGDNFSEPVRVSDAPWYIAACPFSGPSLISDGQQTLFVSWMDGRNDEAGNFSQTDIWLATSTDGGQTFSANQRVNETSNVYHNLPSLALDESGRLHVLWQAKEAGRDVLYYTTSTDEGQTFAPAQVLVDSSENNNHRPTNASLFVTPGGVVYASWVDSAGGYLASWQTAAGDEE